MYERVIIMSRKDNLIKPFLVSYAVISICIVLFMLPFTYSMNKIITRQVIIMSENALSDCKEIFEECVEDAIVTASEFARNEHLQDLLNNIDE